MILSWDIGISNLAWCLLSKEGDVNGGEKGIEKGIEKEEDKYIIHDWNVINFMDDEDDKLIRKCSGILKTKKTPCTRSGSLKHEDLFYCKLHYKGENIEIVKEKKINYRKIPLHMLASKLTKRLDLIDFFQYDLSSIIIENQPKIATAAVKHVMDFLLCYLTIRAIDKNKNVKIVTISPRRKLSVYKGPYIECNIKDKHSKNKFLGIEFCRYMLKNNVDEEKWSIFFESIKKKDDIADAFLQGVWYIH